MDSIAIQRAAVRRRRELERKLRIKRGFSSSAHVEQRKAIDDQSMFRAWQCSRRAGKTTTVLIEFHEDHLIHSGSEYAFVAPTQDSAKRIIWRLARDASRDYNLAWRLMEGDLEIRAPDGSKLEIHGADNPGWVDKLQGRKFRRIWVDEAAFFRIDQRSLAGGSESGLRYLVHETLEGCVADEEGSITLMGRPGIVKWGFFWDVCSGFEKGWSLRKWTWRDNPAVCEAVAKLIARKKKANPGVEQTAAHRRNWENEWVDTVDGDRVYGHLDIERNGIDEWEVQQGDRVILGLDIGWHDYTAIAVCTWSERHPYFVELCSWRKRHQTVEQIAAKIDEYQRLYPGLQMVADAANAQVVGELQRRYRLPIIAAEKANKDTWIGLIDSDMAEGRYKILNPRSSVRVEEALALCWDRTRSGVIKERNGQPNDACDAALYAYRMSSYNHERPEPTPRYDRLEAWQRQLEREEEHQLAAEQDEGRDRYGRLH